jgi:UDP-N-acetylmuramate--alanine ligase
MILMNNLELDHPDYYKDINHMISVFQKYANKLTKNQLLIINGDDKNLKQIKPKSKILTFGIKNSKADITVKNIQINTKKHNQSFDVYAFGKKFGNFEIELPGLLNVYNALAAISIAISLKVSAKDIKIALKKFPGI